MVPRNSDTAGILSQPHPEGKPCIYRYTLGEGRRELNWIASLTWLKVGKSAGRQLASPADLPAKVSYYSWLTAPTDFLLVVKSFRLAVLACPASATYEERSGWPNQRYCYAGRCGAKSASAEEHNGRRTVLETRRNDHHPAHLPVFPILWCIPHPSDI